MSDSQNLPSGMENLTITDEEQTPKANRTPSHSCHCALAISRGETPTCHPPPKTRDLAVYKALPPDYKSRHGHMVYGWPTTPERCYELLKWNLKSVNPHHEHDISSMVFLTRLLAQATGYRWILGYAVCKPDEQAETDKLVYKGPRGPGVRVLGASSTYSDRLYYRRPSTEQMDIFNTWLGEPRWFETLSAKEDFPINNFENFYPRGRV